MSRIAKRPITIPAGVTVSNENGVFTATGPKGTLTRSYRNEVSIEVADGAVQVSKAKESLLAKALIGTYASHIKNMFQGVVTPFQKKLQIEGVGFKVALDGNTLVFSLGFSHEVRVVVPADITAVVEKNAITFTGIDKEKVGQFAAQIRALKKPEPYKGKGIRYEGEYIRRKQGKKSS
jgi:large subunit ribosomal protein L6